MKQVLSCLVAILLTTVVLGQSNFKSVPKNSVPDAAYKSFVKGIPILNTTTKDPLFKGISVLEGLELKAQARDVSGQVYYLETRSKDNLLLQRGGPVDLESRTMNYLNRIAPMIGINHPEEMLSMISSHQDNLGQHHVKLQQEFKGVPVFGQEVLVHFKQAGQGYQGRLTDISADFNTKASIEEDAALASVLAEQVNYKVIPSRLHHLIKGSQIEKELVIYEIEGEVHLAYHVSVYPNLAQRMEYFIDAHSGKVLRKYNSLCSLNHSHVEADILETKTTASGTDLNGQSQTFETLQNSGTFFMIDTSKPSYNASRSSLPDNPVGALMSLDARNSRPDDNMQISHITSTANTWDAKSVSAHENMEVAYEYFRTTHSRNSIDGKGSSVISIINVADPETGQSFENAFWNGAAMFYGNGGTGFTTKPYQASLDVAGHEMTHGVIQNTANLVYQSQSGALNEHLADVFAVLIENEDYRIGEDIISTQAISTGALRNMADPNNGQQRGQNGWQPAHMNEYLNLGPDQDNGGVHFNSGIPNKAFFNLTEAIGAAKTQAIYYKAMTDYLSRNSQFVDMRLAIIQATSDIHGSNAQEVIEAGKAFDAVGIVGGTATTNPNDELEVNPGDEFILVLQVSDQTIFKINLATSASEQVSTTSVLRRPSITDDGKTAYFVAEDRTIKKVTLDGSAANETTVSTDAVWNNLAISKDGNRLAAVTNQQDTSIYVFNLTTSPAQGQKFRLFNPTFSEGVTSGGVVAADALEWSYDNESLFYDAFNVLKNAQGDDIDYWDVGILDAWNTGSSSFGNGDIQKIFGSLPEGISVGNPIFAKLNPNLMAFDYLDDNTNQFSILVANIESNKSALVENNTSISFPSFNKGDTQIAYETTTYNNGDLATGMTKIIGLADDKFTKSSGPSEFANGAFNPVFYSVGDRVTAAGLAAPEAIAASDITETSFRINWNSVPEATDYLWDIATDASFANVILTNRSSEGELFDILTGADPNTSYFYRVRATDGSRTSSNSNVIEVVTSSVVIPAPLATAGSNITTTTFRVNWNQVATATDYLWDVSSNAAFSNILLQDESSQGQLFGDVQGANANTSYFYRVRATDGTVTSDYSNIVEVITASVLAIGDDEIEEIVLFPNPSLENIQLKTEINERVNLWVTNMQGQLIFKDFGTLQSLNRVLEIQSEKLDPGVYILNLEGKTTNFSARFAIH